eukprot:SAG11_NODE_12250_length_713_cov_1.096091_2_plen_95_part_01
MAPPPGELLSPSNSYAVSTTGLELGRNVTVRIALDRADTPDCGALQVIPCVHRRSCTGSRAQGAQPSLSPSLPGAVSRVVVVCVCMAQGFALGEH